MGMQLARKKDALQKKMTCSMVNKTIDVTEKYEESIVRLKSCLRWSGGENPHIDPLLKIVEEDLDIYYEGERLCDSRKKGQPPTGDP